MKYQQVLLNDGNTNTVAWIDAETRKGNLVRIKNDNRWWEVKETYYPYLDRSEIKSEWRVGGL